MSPEDVMGAAMLAANGTGRFVAAIAMGDNAWCKENCRWITLVEVDPDTADRITVGGLKRAFEPNDPPEQGLPFSLGKYLEIKPGPPGNYLTGVRKRADRLNKGSGHRDALNSDFNPGVSESGAEQIRRQAEWGGIAEVVTGGGAYGTPKMRASSWLHCCEE